MNGWRVVIFRDATRSVAHYFAGGKFIYPSCGWGGRRKLGGTAPIKNDDRLCRRCAARAGLLEHADVL